MKKIIFTIFASGALAAFPVMGQHISIDTVFVGNAGNASDSTGFGTVSYDYRIGTHPVTNAQYAAFLNSVASLGDPHGLYNPNMGTSIHGGISRTGSGSAGDPFIYGLRTAGTGYNAGQSMGNMPVNFVSFWDSARFTNWLTSGDTEIGVYHLANVTNPDPATLIRDLTFGGRGNSLWAIANQDEWYKAAYYDPTLNNGAGGYWLYPTQSNSAPTATIPNVTNPNSANRLFSLGPLQSDGTVTPVGGYALADSYYGTFDQGGNVWERLDEVQPSGTTVMRGGSYFYIFNELGLQSTFSTSFDPSVEDASFGFRLTNLTAIPEPSTSALILGSLTVLVLMRRRFNHRG